MVTKLKNQNTFKFQTFSTKQIKVLTWWTEGSPVRDKDMIICEGAVRSGKTIVMSLSYVLWAMSNFNQMNFGMAGKTIGSFKRNVWFWLKLMLKGRGFNIQKLTEIGDNVFAITKGNVTNYFYIFAGKDARSQDLVQGFTAAGFFFDEVTLMPEEFVNQAVARCSVSGAKIWFNCNPEGPFHWFKTNWLDKIEEKNGFRLHFLIDDNPSLDEKTKQRYKSMFSGIFYQRYINGEWVAAEGLIYDMFSEASLRGADQLCKIKIRKKWIGIDYGQSNATVFLLVGLGDDNNIYILDEYYHEGRSSLQQKSPARYAKDFREWLIKNGVDGYPVVYESIFIDPSAKGFMLQLHEEGIRGIRQADNDVDKGIKLIASLLDNNKIFVNKKCENTIKEFGSYCWDPKAQDRGEDKPLKQNDHAMDALRYVVNGNRILFQRLLLLK